MDHEHTTNSYKQPRDKTWTQISQKQQRHKAKNKDSKKQQRFKTQTQDSQKSQRSKIKNKILNWPIINRLDNSDVDKIPIKSDKIKRTGHERKN
jgi:hypothetical protein